MLDFYKGLKRVGDKNNSGGQIKLYHVLGKVVEEGWKKVGDTQSHYCVKCSQKKKPWQNGIVNEYTAELNSCPSHPSYIEKDTIHPLKTFPQACRKTKRENICWARLNK